MPWSCHVSVTTVPLRWHCYANAMTLLCQRGGTKLLPVAV